MLERKRKGGFILCEVSVFPVRKADKRLHCSIRSRLYDGFAGAQNIEFQRGEIVGDVGGNAAGKTAVRSRNQSEFIRVRSVYGNQAAADRSVSSGADGKRRAVIEAEIGERLVELQVDRGNLRLQFGGLLRRQAGEVDLGALCHGGVIARLRGDICIYERLVLRNRGDGSLVNPSGGILRAGRRDGNLPLGHG